MYLPMPTPGWVAFVQGDDDSRGKVDADEALQEFISLHNRHVRKEPTVRDFAKKHGRLGVPPEFARTFTIPEGFELWGLSEEARSEIVGAAVTMEDERWWHAAVSTFANISDLSYIASLGAAAQNLPTFRRAVANNFTFREGQEGPECVYRADTGLAAPFADSGKIIGEELSEALDRPYAVATPLLKMPASDDERRDCVAQHAAGVAIGFARFFLALPDDAAPTLLGAMKAAMLKRVEERNGFGACLLCGRAFDLTHTRQKTRKFLCDQRCISAFNRDVSSVYKELAESHGYSVADLKSVGLGRSEEEIRDLLGLNRP